MGEGSNQFRGATFGGFNRQDVLSYLTTTESAYEAKLSQLRSELETSKQEAVESKRKVAELEEKLRETEKLSKSVKDSLSKTETERDKKTENLKQREDELSKLRRELAELTPKALAYDKIKERAATIELDAHERAQIILDEAKKEAGLLQKDYAVWIREAQVKYELLRTGLNEAFMRSTVELEQICNTFDRISGDFEGYESLLRDLLSRADEMADSGERESVFSL